MLWKRCSALAFSAFTLSKSMKLIFSMRNVKCEIERSSFQGKFEKESEKNEGSGPMTLPQASLFIDF